jgi:hypothetical protein
MGWYGCIFEGGGRAIVEADSFVAALDQIEDQRDPKRNMKAVASLVELRAKDAVEAHAEWWGGEGSK